MTTGVQFRGTVPAGATNRWFTFNWPQQWDVVWDVVPTGPTSGSPQVTWNVALERASTNFITYWVSVTNVSSTPVDIEGRYAILNN